MKFRIGILSLAMLLLLTFLATACGAGNNKPAAAPPAGARPKRKRPPAKRPPPTEPLKPQVLR
ncbi:hypothetical protein HMSSN036_16840 [Paenibacillus macerans]|nr:hypothetical protein HMSSN036_16840 [Paenibacillus macerans]